MYKKPKVIFYLWWNTKCLCLGLRYRQGCPFLSLLFNIVWSPDQYKEREKKKKTYTDLKTSETVFICRWYNDV